MTQEKNPEKFKECRNMWEDTFLERLGKQAQQNYDSSDVFGAASKREGTTNKPIQCFSYLNSLLNAAIA